MANKIAPDAKPAKVEPNPDEAPLSRPDPAANAAAQADEPKPDASGTTPQDLSSPAYVTASTPPAYPDGMVNTEGRLDQTNPGGRYQYGDTFVDANGQPLKDQKG